MDVQERYHPEKSAKQILRNSRQMPSPSTEGATEPGTIHRGRADPTHGGDLGRSVHGRPEPASANCFRVCDHAPLSGPMTVHIRRHRAIPRGSDPRGRHPPRRRSPDALPLFPDLSLVATRHRRSCSPCCPHDLLCESAADPPLPPGVSARVPLRSPIVSLSVMRFCPPFSGTRVSCSW
jgi:hypothetical protein